MKYQYLSFVFALLLFQQGCSKKEEFEELPKPTGEKVQLDPKLVAKGKEIYSARCAACHRTDGEGLPGLGPRLNSPDFLGLASDEFIRKTILLGREGTSMIPFKDILKVPDESNALVAYIRHWQNDYATFRSYNVDWEKKISGDPKQGRKSFRTYCASCHGPNGGGYADGGSGLAIGLSGFLRVASDDYIKKTIEIGRAGTAMKPFGHGRGLAQISEKEIDNIVSYLRSLEK